MRAGERLLHISIESIIDICALIVKGLSLGLPSEENDVFNKLEKAKIISKSMANTLKRMKGFRNVLVHRYAGVDNKLVYKNLRENLNDFSEFREHIIKFLQKQKE